MKNIKYMIAQLSHGYGKNGKADVKMTRAGK